MATADQITQVRLNTNEPDSTTFTDLYISGLVDAFGDPGGVNLASGAIWRQKAATYSELVDVSEAGASRKMSDLFANALKMADFYDGAGADEVAAASGSGRAKVHVIERIN